MSTWVSNLFSSMSAAALSFFATIIAGLLALCGVLYSQIAPRQKNLNDALALFLEELQKDRAQHIAHASQLGAQLIQANKRVQQLEGELRNKDQVIASLRRKLNDYSGYKKLDAVEYDPPGPETDGDESG